MSFHFFNVLDSSKFRNVTLDHVTCLVGLTEGQRPGHHDPELLLHLPAHLGHGDGELPGQAGQAEPQVSPGQVAANQGAGACGHGPQVQISSVSEDVQVCQDAVILIVDVETGGHALSKFSWTIYWLFVRGNLLVLPKVMSNLSKDELN